MSVERGRAPMRTLEMASIQTKFLLWLPEIGRGNTGERIETISDCSIQSGTAAQHQVAVVLYKTPRAEK